MATRKIGVVAGSSASLQSFASSVLAKATKNAVALGGASESVSVALGASAIPKDAHTCVINTSNFTFVRSVLPRGSEDQLQLRDALDVFPSSGINNAQEVAAAKAELNQTAKVAVAAAKSNGNKLTLLVKQVSKFENVNALFQQCIEEAAQSAGVAVEIVDSATATNNLIMFPEKVGVIATADTASADNIELALSGLYSTSRVFHRAGGAKTIPAGHSPATAAVAVAEALKELGLTSEANKVAEAAKKASDIAGESILRLFKKKKKRKKLCKKKKEIKVSPQFFFSHLCSSLFVCFLF